jgi:hypothetical protein
MALSLVLHRVGDFDAWRGVYDSLAPVQAAGGVTEGVCSPMAGHPDNVLVIHHFDSVATARGFVTSPDLLDATERAGVKAGPRIEFYD